MSDEYLRITMPQPNDPPSENVIRGLHWAKARDRLKPWKDSAFYATNSVQHSQRATARDVPANVLISIQFKNNRNRDPSNYVGTVVKAIVDGLVLARVWPDDNPEWVTILEPLCVGVPKGSTPTTIIRLQRREGQ